jgi:hypothetical protein
MIRQGHSSKGIARNKSGGHIFNPVGRLALFPCLELTGFLAWAFC